MKKRVIDDVSVNDLETFVQNLMEQIGETDVKKAIELINSGKIVLANIKTDWEEKDDLISFSVISDGTSGPTWLYRLRNKGVYVDETVQKVLLSDDFKPTVGIITYVHLLQGRDVQTDEKYLTAESQKRKLIELCYGAEIACLTREKFSTLQINLMGVHQVVFNVGELFFAVNGVGLNCLCGFKRRLDNTFAYAFRCE